MFDRLRFLTTLLSLALVAIDAVVIVAGHSHEHPAIAGSPCSAGDTQSHGCHHHACTAHPAEQPADSPPNSPQRDDCSLCRHFSQPVVVASPTFELVGGDYVASVPVESPQAHCFVYRPSHPARGPPSVNA